MKVRKEDKEYYILSTIFFNSFYCTNKSKIKQTEELIRQFEAKYFTKNNGYVLRAIQSFLDEYKHLPSKTEFFAYMRFKIAKKYIYDLMCFTVNEIEQYSPGIIEKTIDLYESVVNEIIQGIIDGNNGRK